MGKMARNEQRKLGATLLNAAGAGVLTATLIALGMRLSFNQGWLLIVIALAVVTILHAVTRVVLCDLEE